MWYEAEDRKCFFAHILKEVWMMHSFQPAMLYLSSDSIGIEELSSVAAVIVEIKRAEDFADTQHIGPGYSLEGPWVLVVGLPLSLFLLHGGQTLSAHHLFVNTSKRSHFAGIYFTELMYIYIKKNKK